MLKTTNSGFPKKVSIREVGPREGFQFHKCFVPTDQKLELINSLAKTGVKEVEVTSFVRTDIVPQLADSEDVCLRLEKHENVKNFAVYLNSKGYLRSLEFPKLSNFYFGSIALSEKFLLENNNITFEGAIKRLLELLVLFQGAKMSLSISATFGYATEGRFETSMIIGKVSEIYQRLDGRIAEICLADTVGIALPEQIKKVVGALQDQYSDTKIRLHLHDTFGTGGANSYAGLQMGVENFDASVAGMGGCPFAKGASGNICTEDFIYLCHELGIETGCDLELYKTSAKLAEQILKTKLPGRLKAVNYEVLK